MSLVSVISCNLLPCLTDCSSRAEVFRAQASSKTFTDYAKSHSLLSRQGHALARLCPGLQEMYTLEISITYQLAKVNLSQNLRAACCPVDFEKAAFRMRGLGPGALHRDFFGILILNPFRKVSN